MNAADACFKVAERADKCGGFIFYFVLCVSGLLAALDNPSTEKIGHPCLIASATLAIVCTVATTIYQTEGNRALRSTQLSLALGAGAGEPIRADYYNNILPQSLLRVAAMTLENTLCTRAVLSKVAVRMRIKVGVYFVLPLVMSTCRSTPTAWLVVLAQTLFSADLVLKLVRLERYRVRTIRVFDHLEQFFLQAGGNEKPNDVAILIGAFTDYECAKDEAALPLPSKLFLKLNPELSAKWEEMQRRLKLK